MISPYAVDVESKHPDYIYIKYAIYKESMEQRKNAELQSKVISVDSVNICLELTSNERDEWLMLHIIFRNGSM